MSRRNNSKPKKKGYQSKQNDKRSGKFVDPRMRSDYKEAPRSPCSTIAGAYVRAITGAAIPVPRNEIASVKMGGIGKNGKRRPPTVSYSTENFSLQPEKAAAPVQEESFWRRRDW